MSPNVHGSNGVTLGPSELHRHLRLSASYATCSHERVPKVLKPMHSQQQASPRSNECHNTTRPQRGGDLKGASAGGDLPLPVEHPYQGGVLPLGSPPKSVRPHASNLLTRPGCLHCNVVIRTSENNAGLGTRGQAQGDTDVQARVHAEKGGGEAKWPPVVSAETF